MTDPHAPDQPELEPSTVRRVGLAHGRAGVGNFRHLIEEKHQALYDEGYAEGEGKKVDDDEKRARQGTLEGFLSEEAP